MMRCAVSTTASNLNSFPAAIFKPRSEAFKAGRPAGHFRRLLGSTPPSRLLISLFSLIVFLLPGAFYRAMLVAEGM